MAWWRADQGRGRRAHVRCRVTTWKPLSEGWGRRPRRSHLLSTPLHSTVPICHVAMLHSTLGIRPSVHVTVLYCTVRVCGRGGMAVVVSFNWGKLGVALQWHYCTLLLPTCCSPCPLVSPIQFPTRAPSLHALPCPAPLGVEPAQRQFFLKKTLAWQLQPTLQYSTGDSFLSRTCTVNGLAQHARKRVGVGGAQAARGLAHSLTDT
jgi:hypothetical protein